MYKGFQPEMAPAAGGKAATWGNAADPAHALAYRADIDGLRAIAILSVVVFHAELGFLTGGFVGVDVFFVISGFLISSIVLKEAQSGTFSILNFYKRRTLRIFPALFTVIAACFIAGWFLFPPREYKEFAHSALAAAAYYANFYFDNQSDYFAADAITMPLLHTWSLAVEEQFYVLAPGLLLLAVRFPRHAKAAFLLLFATSLVFSHVLIGKDASKAFYMLPSRAFELMTGTALAMGLVPSIRNRLFAEAAGLAGLALIAAATLFYSASTPFPGLAALVPCLGAALLIHANRHVQTATARLLSTPAVVFIGKVSYSFYLWHWPVLVFAVFRYGEGLGTPARLCLMGAAFAASVVSYYLVEQPARHRGTRLKAVTVLVIGALAILAVLGARKIARSPGLDAWRLPEQTLTFVEQNPVRLDNRGICLNRTVSEKSPGLDCITGVADAPVEFMLFGDSHARAIANMVSEIAVKNEKAGYLLTRDGCAPLMSLDAVQRQKFPKCAEHFAVFEERFATPSLKVAVMAARWAVYENGEPMPNEWKRPFELLALTKEESRPVFEAMMTATVQKFLDSGRRVVFVGPVPELEFNVPSEMTKALMQGKQPEFWWPRSDFDKRQKDMLAFLARLDAMDGVDVIYPHDVLCDAERCRTADDGKALYIDDDRLSPAGVALIAPMLEKAMTGE